MKKLLALSIAALVLITLSSCQFNLFAAFDRIEIPSVADLNAKASSDEEGFVSDVEDYIENDFLENEDVTDEQIDAIVANLETIYTTPPDVETGQKAAVLAGEIIINSDPDTSFVVNGIIGAVSDALSANGTIDPDTLIASIFPDNIDLAGLQNILDDLDQAALAYADFATTVSSGGTADWMSSGEVGDMVQLAVVSLVVSDLRAQVGEDALLDAINNGTALTVTNPLDTTGTSLYDDELVAILTFSGLAL